MEEIFGNRNKYFDAVFARLPDLQGKVVAVTGTTSGTGLILAAIAVRKGAACVILANRDSSRAVANWNQVKSIASSDTVVKLVSCDLQSFASVREAASEIEAIASQYSGLDVLCNNAGIMAHPDKRTTDGYDVQMQSNHLSHFLLTALLFPVLEKASVTRGDARIVHHTSGARNWRENLEAVFFQKCEPCTLGGDSMKASMTRYVMSKLSNAVFGQALHLRLKEKGSKVKSITCEPGVVGTSLGTSLQQAHRTNGSNRCIMNLVGCCMNFSGPPGQTPADGTIPLMLSCFEPDTASGDLLMPFDPMKGGGAQLIKPIVGGVEHIVKRVEGKDEHLVMSEENQKLLWAESSASTGIKFL